jgi:hypothetical protein
MTRRPPYTAPAASNNDNPPSIGTAGSNGEGSSGSWAEASGEAQSRKKRNEYERIFRRYIDISKAYIYLMNLIILLPDKFRNDPAA